MSQTSRRAVLSGLLALPAMSTAQTAVGADAGIRTAIARFHEADRLSQELDTAHIHALRRYEDLGGDPPYPETLFQTEQDRREFNFHVVECNGEPDYRHRFKPAMAVYLRRAPCRRYLPHERPVTEADNFPAATIGDGYIKIVSGSWAAWPEAQARANEIIAAWDARVAEIDRRREAAGLTAAENALTDAEEERDQAKQAVLAAKAETLEGAYLKLALLLTLYEGSQDLDAELADDAPNITLDYRLSLSIVRDLASLTGRV